MDGVDLCPQLMFESSIFSLVMESIEAPIAYVGRLVLRLLASLDSLDHYIVYYNALEDAAMKANMRDPGSLMCSPSSTGFFSPGRGTMRT